MKSIADQYQELFNYLDQELGALAVETQLEDIINICKKINLQP